ncbi:MAG TPA: hypothetical protein VGB18_00190 [Candidatus Thermoplasmatota archaeon]
MANSEPAFSPPADYGGSMAAGNGEPLTVRGALQTITKLEGLEVGLFQRTEGITNIVWGLVVAGMFFAYQALGSAFPATGPYWGPVLWIPWIGAGVFATAIVWRSAHLSANVPFDKTHSRREGFVYMGVFVTVMFLGFMVFGIFLADEGLRLREPGYMMGLMSLAILIVSLFIRKRATPVARRMHFIVGSIGIIATILLALLSPADNSAYFLQTVAGVILLGGGWLVSGAYLTLKG